MKLDIVDEFLTLQEIAAYFESRNSDVKVELAEDSTGDGDLDLRIDDGLFCFIPIQEFKRFYICSGSEAKYIYLNWNYEDIVNIFRRNLPTYENASVSR